MELKKNPEADLNRRTGLFFAIGLAIVTSLSLWAINFKSGGNSKDLVELSAVDDTLEEEVEEVVMEDAPLPQPLPEVPQVPEEIEIKENDVVIETKIESVETSKDEVVPEQPVINDTPEEDIPEEIPFALIEDKPMFEACKNLPKAQLDACFKENLDKHVKKHFRYPEIAQEMNIQGRVSVIFKINKDGSISVTGVRGPDKSLEAEARRIMEKLPPVIPGKQRGKPVTVTYSYPIMFKLN